MQSAFIFVFVAILPLAMSLNIAKDCTPLEKHIIEKKDWSKNLSDDLKKIANEDLKPAIIEIKKRVDDLVEEYVSIVNNSTNVVPDIKTILGDFIKKVSVGGISNIDMVAENAISIFASNILPEIQYLAEVQSNNVTDEIISHEKRIGFIISKECTSIIRNLETEEVNAEQAIQNELVENSVNVPNYIYSFIPSEEPSLSERLSPGDLQLFRDNKIKEVGPVLVKLANETLSDIVKEVQTQILNAHSAILGNIQASIKITPEEKLKRLGTLDKLMKEHSPEIEHATTKITAFINSFAEWTTNVSDDHPTLLDDIADETQVIADKINNIGYSFFTELSFITGGL